MTHQIRAANSADATALAHIGAATFAMACYATTPQEDIDSYIASELTTTRFKEHIACPSKSLFVVEVNRQICGYLMLCQEGVPAELEAQRPLELRRIYVLPEYHGSGAANGLIMGAIREAIAGNHDSLWLGVSGTNERGIGFYQKHGFNVVGPCHFPLGSFVYQGDLMVRSMSPDNSSRDFSSSPGE